MTMTTADAASQDGSMGPRAEQLKRRHFTAEYAEYKAAVLGEYDSAKDTERGVILRRDGSYSWHLAEGC